MITQPATLGQMLKRYFLQYWRAFLWATTPFFAVIVADLTLPLRVVADYSTLVLAADGTLLHAFLNRNDKWRMPTQLKEITPQLRQTILFKEDKYFYYHPGINPVAMLRAAARNVVSGKRTSGASTITMQVVRLLQPRQRTYTSKIIEVFRALQLEIHFSKDEILQLYLNLIPYGSNIEGIKSASVLYLGKAPQLLSLAEITALTIIPNRPSSLRLGVANAAVVQERNKWLERFRRAQLFDNQTIEDALNEPLNARRRSAPRNAPHLSIRLKNQQPLQSIIQTNIVLNRQHQAEQLVRNYIGRLGAFRIHNAAVLVINNRTAQIETYVGSAGFDDPTDGGQVDGVRAVRSPGSTLKPLVYGLAFDRGMLTPKSALNDVPTNFSGFEPENFDRHFNGKVTSEFALANSLNIPAVKVLQLVSTPALVEVLKKAGFATIKKNARDLGLSMILGGCGATLEELTRLFSGFEPSSKSTLLSPEAKYLVTAILSQITRPDLPNNFDNTYHLPRIAWKTGTSYGKKDAWSIGYNQNYTVGVWVGNFSGEGVPELSGANTATPLLFDVFNAIDYNSTAKQPTAPRNLKKRKICAETGDVPNEFCSNQIIDYHIMGVSKYQKCDHLKWVFTNSQRTVSYCTTCLPDGGYQRKLYPNLSPDLVDYYQHNGFFYDKIPPHNPACTRIQTTNAPQITSPNDGSTYFIDPTEPPQLQLSCLAQNDVKEIYWYINDKLYQKTSPLRPIFFTPKAGKTKISCSDDAGRSSDVVILVK